MVRSRMALWMRNASAGAAAIVALSVMLAGCVVEPADIVDVEEDVAESASELDETNVAGDLEGHSGDPQKDPDPVPWHVHSGRNGDPGPDPDDMSHSVPGTPGNHDEE